MFSKLYLGRIAEGKSSKEVQGSQVMSTIVARESLRGKKGNSMFSVVLETKSLKFWLLNRTCGEKARRDSPVAVGFWPLTFCHRETGPHFSTAPSRRFSQSLAVLTRRLALAGRRSPRSVGSPSRPPSERTPANVSLDLFRLGSERVTRPNLRRVLRNEFSIAFVGAQQVAMQRVGHLQAVKRD